MENLIQIDGNMVKAICSANAEFSKTNLDVKNYEVIYEKNEGKIIVSFLDKNRDRSLRGEGPLKSYNYEISPDTLGVKREIHTK